MRQSLWREKLPWSIHSHRNVTTFFSGLAISNFFLQCILGVLISSARLEKSQTRRQQISLAISHKFTIHLLCIPYLGWLWDIIPKWWQVLKLSSKNQVEQFILVRTAMKIIPYLFAYKPRPQTWDNWQWAQKKWESSRL